MEIKAPLKYPSPPLQYQHKKFGGITSPVRFNYRLTMAQFSEGIRSSLNWNRAKPASSITKLQTKPDVKHQSIQSQLFFSHF